MAVVTQGALGLLYSKSYLTEAPIISYVILFQLAGRLFVPGPCQALSCRRALVPPAPSAWNKLAVADSSFRFQLQGHLFGEPSSNTLSKIPLLVTITDVSACSQSVSYHLVLKNIDLLSVSPTQR